MTDATIALTELAEKGADVLRRRVQFATQRLMEMAVGTPCGAGCDEKNPAERIDSRNGYRDGAWETRAGTLPRAFRPVGCGVGLWQLIPWIDGQRRGARLARRRRLA